MNRVMQAESHVQAAIARIFSSAVFRELVRDGRSSLFARLVHEIYREESTCTWSVGRFFDECFNFLKRSDLRNEYAYKSAIIQKILLGSHSLNTASIVDEFRVGGNKADLVMLNGTSNAFEIKSERDRLDRLCTQVSSYSEVFAEVTVLCAEKHLRAVQDTVPDFVGVSVLTERFQISKVRKGVNDPERTNSVSIFNSITKKEAAEVLKRLGVAVPDLPNTLMHHALELEFSRLPSAQVHDEMVKVLKITRSLSGMSESLQEVPRSLRVFALTVPMKKRGKENLLGALDTPLMDALKWG